jgi:hypothetical protein
VPSKELIAAVYGRPDKDASYGSLIMIVKGLIWMIEKDRLPYRVQKERDENGITLGLYPKPKRR